MCCSALQSIVVSDTQTSLPSRLQGTQSRGVPHSRTPSVATTERWPPIHVLYTVLHEAKECLRRSTLFDAFWWTTVWWTTVW